MELAVQPSLVERAVFEAARADAVIRSHYERQFSDCYQNRDGAQRDRAFAELHERWFNELGLRDQISQLVHEFPYFQEKVNRLMVMQAPGVKVQTAELFGTPEQFSVAMAVAVTTLLDRPAFAYWARHEFLHINDMLDPAFGYDAGHRPAGATIAAKNLTQDRYAVLWAMTVDARLAQRELAPPEVLTKRETELIRAFGLNDTDSVARVFEGLRQGGSWLSPNHRTLLAWAKGGLPEFRDAASMQVTSATPTPGAPCPLCGFPTFEWAAGRADWEELAPLILADSPDWTPQQVICGRCADVYRGYATAQALSA